MANSDLQAAVDALMYQGRARQIASSKAAGRRILNAYLSVQQDIDAQLARLQRQITEAEASGEPVRVSWLYERQRLQGMQRQVYEAVEGFTGHAQQLTLQMMGEGARNGVSDASDALAAMLTRELANGGMQPLTAEVLSSFNRLNQAALEDAASNLFRIFHTGSDGRQIRRVASIFNELAPDAQARARRTLIYAVATGQHPSVTARTLAQQTGIARNRALTIARTEQLNAYRRSSIATYAANSDVCEGWKWLAAAGCCDFCASMNDTLHPLDEAMESHPNCRCCASPVAKSLSSILAAYGIAA